MRIEIRLNRDQLLKLEERFRSELPFNLRTFNGFKEMTHHVLLQPENLIIILNHYPIWSTVSNKEMRHVKLDFTLNFNVREGVISTHEDFEEYKKLYQEENRKTTQTYQDRLVYFIKKHFKIREGDNADKKRVRIVGPSDILHNHRVLSVSPLSEFANSGPYIIYKIEFNSEETAKNIEYYTKLLIYRLKHDF